jgi:hypothetical protein
LWRRCPCRSHTRLQYGRMASSHTWHRSSRAVSRYWSSTSRRAR